MDEMPRLDSEGRWINKPEDLRVGVIPEMEYVTVPIPVLLYHLLGHAALRMNRGIAEEIVVRLSHSMTGVEMAELVDASVQGVK